MKSIKKYNTGLVIGRFQPLHNGHIYLIKCALEICEKIVIAIGSSNVENSDNPFNYNIRRRMILEFIEHTGLKSRIIKIIPSIDIPDDFLWRDTLLRKAGKIDIIIGNNDEGVNKFFEQAGYPVARVEYLDRMHLEGKKIRELIRSNRKWDDRVATYVREIIDSI